MSYEDEWTWWLEEACYRTARGVSLLTNPSEVSRNGWHQICCERSQIESHHGVHIFRGEFLKDDLGEAAEVYVAKYPWVALVVREIPTMSEISGHALMGLLLGYSGEAVGEFLKSKVLPALQEEVDIGDLHVSKAGATSPYGDPVLGDVRCAQLALYLTGKPTPGYEIWWGKTSGGARRVNLGEVRVCEESLNHLLKRIEENR